MGRLREETSLDLSIIVVNYNVKDHLRECLASISETTQGLSYEIMVVDNNSADGSAEMVSTEFPDVLLFALDENMGFVRANNSCILKSRGRYILMLNPDTVIIRNSVLEMMSFFEDNPTTGAIGCKMLNSDRTVQPSCYNFPNLREVFGIYFFGDKVFSGLKKIDFDKINEVDFVRGAFLLLSRKCLDNVGLLDEKFFMFGEESDLCFRMKKMGWNVMYIPDTVIIHHSGKSSEQVPEKVYLQKIRSLIYYFQKNYGMPKALLLRLIVFLGVGLRLVFRGILIRKGELSGWKRLPKRTQIQALKLTLGLTK